LAGHASVQVFIDTGEKRGERPTIRQFLSNHAGAQGVFGTTEIELDVKEFVMGQG